MFQNIQNSHDKTVKPIKSILCFSIYIYIFQYIFEITSTVLRKEKPYVAKNMCSLPTRKRLKKRLILSLVFS